MAAFQTPMRKIPGAFINTPAIGKTDATRRRLDFSDPATVGQQIGRGANNPPASQQPEVQQPARSEPLPPVLKAARTINLNLQNDESFPELDSYCRPGASSDYDYNPDPSWMPFGTAKTYNIPEQILDKINGGEITTKLGLFAEINHAWASIDDSFFLWDYTHPHPEIVGWEDGTQNITGVALVPPKKGVFVDTITHVLVLVQGSDVQLLGVAATTLPTGARKVELYHTKMFVHKGGPDVSLIAGTETGRIFFGGQSDADIYELYYQSEEKWFTNRVGKINHTNPGWSIVPGIPTPMDFFGTKRHEHLIDIKIDDSRNLLYTLSNKSTIRTYHMEAPGKLNKLIEKERNHCLRDVAHMIDRSPLLNDATKIVALSPISAREASKLHLMALTNTGCRLFLSATSSASYMMGPSSSLAPQSMQVQFVKFPPREQARGDRREEAVLDLTSKSLSASAFGARFPPGYFIDVVRQEQGDLVFVSAPDTGKIKKTTPSTALKYFEQFNWVDMKGTNRTLAIGLTGTPFSAAKQPQGFGNELAVQFDQPPCQIAVLTNNGVNVIQRRRLVDIFAEAIRSAPGEAGLERVTREFIYQYGRVETISAALAVACGQGSDLRMGTSRVADHTTQDLARHAFVEYGGQPTLSEGDAVLSADSVKLSARHDALALYLTRLTRTLWKTKVVTMGVEPAGGPSVTSTIPTIRLTLVQENLERLKHFLETNKAMIQGLSGPSDLQRVSTRQGEVAVQAEHQALDGLQKLMASIIEGISFVQMLFDERVTDIYLRLDEPARQGLRDLTYENLFSQPAGKELAKLLVKAIVNRNIQNGSNVETVADALRRRCGSFCSPDDVIIFKAQEQLQRATEQISNPNILRQTLSESLLLFERVASSLTPANLRGAVEQYVQLKYYAGAIQLCLAVAKEKDRGNKALSWYNDGQPASDSRQDIYNERKRCYDLIHEVLARLDAETGAEPQMVDGRPTLAATKRMEAYRVVNESDDEVFHFGLYEWYISQDWTDRVLAIDSPHVITYLQRLAAIDVQHADLLCRFYTGRHRFFEAAQIQYDLATSEFALGIKQRITLLSRAKSNASVNTVGVARQAQQQLNREIAELLEIAHIQDDLVERLIADERIPDDKKEEIEKTLNGPIQNLTELFNDYADQAGYYDLCLLIYHAADFHNARVIAETWDNLIANTHFDVAERRRVWEESQGHGADAAPPPQPYEVVSSYIQNIAHRTSLDSLIFPVDTLLPIVCAYAVSNDQNASIGADPCWPILLFLQLGVSHSLIVRVLERMFETREHPYVGRREKILVQWINVAVEAWVRDLERRGAGSAGAAAGKGGDGAAIGAGVSDLLAQCMDLLVQRMNSGVRAAEAEELQAIRQESAALRAAVDRIVNHVAQGSVLFR